MSRPGILRLTAFRAGLLSGLGVFALLALVAYLAVFRLFPEPAFNVEVISAGADVERNGGRQIVVGDDADLAVFTATCNDGCDDLWHRRRSGGDAVMEVRVLDASGACLTGCGGGAYVSSGFGAPLTRWTFAGPGKLADQPGLYHLKTDGTLSR